MYEFMKHRAQAAPAEVTIGRLAHYAIAALLAEEIGVYQFNEVAALYTDTNLLLEDPSGHVGRTQFTLGQVSMELGSQMMPARVYLAGIGETGRQFTFKLDSQGKPNYEVYASNACV